MTDAINRFLDMPLWLSVPCTVIYLGACGFLVYTLYRYRNK